MNIKLVFNKNNFVKLIMKWDNLFKYFYFSIVYIYIYIYIYIIIYINEWLNGCKNLKNSYRLKVI